MVKYTVRIIEQHLKETDSQVLPIVLPLVIHQGKQRYPYATNIFDLFSDPALAKAFMFGDMHLLDVSQLTPQQLDDTGLAALLLATFQQAHLRDLVKIIAAIMPYLTKCKAHKQYLQTILMYITRLAKLESKEQFFAAINQLAEPIRSEIMTVDQIWIQEGIEQGLQRGKLEGERSFLLRHLTRKFSHLPSNYLALINNADEETLYSWDEKIAYANSLEEIFR